MFIILLILDAILSLAMCFGAVFQIIWKIQHRGTQEFHFKFFVIWFIIAVLALISMRLT